MDDAGRCNTIRAALRTKESIAAMSVQSFGRLSGLALLLGIAAAIAVSVQAQQPSAPSFTKAQLEQLAAPIALHPDGLLSQILMASTYPTEVVQAARWTRAHPGVSGQALQDAMQKQSWDPSVKALTAVPQTLEMMSDKLEWTQQLGDAFLAQQEDLLAAVQRLRQRAQAAGQLKTSDKQTVGSVEAPTAGGRGPVITIEPANPEYMYVPVYDPRVVYGDWPYPDYEPFYWYPPGYAGAPLLSFAAAVAVGSAIWGHLDWWRGRVDIDVDRYNRFNRTNIVERSWQHDRRHRGNVPYRDAKVAQRFSDGKRMDAREAYRGKADAGRRDLAKEKVAQHGKVKATPDTKSAHTKQAGKGQHSAAARAKPSAKSHASKTHAARNSRHTARPQQASRTRSATHRQQVRGYSARPQGRVHRSVGGGHRAGHRGGGGHRHGGGGRRGRR
jgi:hypothetical protein